MLMEELINRYKEYTKGNDYPIEIYYNRGWFTIMVLSNGINWFSTSGRNLDNAIKKMIKKLKKEIKRR